MKVSVIYDELNSHHSYRLVNGLIACGFDVVNGQTTEKIEAMFVEASYPNEVKTVGCPIFLYDAEDDPAHFEPKAAFYQLVNDPKTLAYAKYNYTSSYLCGLKLIGMPLMDYVLRGHYPARDSQSITWAPTRDAFFIGGPSYYSLGYNPAPSHSHIETEDLNTIPLNIWDKNRSSQRVYHQRLEWVHMLYGNKNIKFFGGLWFNNDANISLEFQKKQFGKGIEKYATHRCSTEELYGAMIDTKYGLCPSGFARSSFRLIELMALGKKILLTNDSNYKYLYNPNPGSFKYIEDGARIDEIILNMKDDDFHDEKSNQRMFAELTPKKMWEDFLKQI